MMRRIKLTKGYETFSQLWVPPERERTAKKDRTGNRYAVRSFNGHKSSILDLCFVDPLMKIATASADRTVRVWNGNTLECLLQLKSHQDIVTSVLAHKLNRNQLWSCSLDKTIRAWDLNLGKNLLTKENNTNNNNNNLMTWKMVQQPQGGEMANGLFCADVDGNVRFFDIQSGDYVSTFGTGLSSPIHSICFADANLFALACQDVVQVWDVRKGSQALLSLTGHSGPVSCVQPLESESNKIISGGVDGTIRVWDIISQSNSDSESGASSNLNLIKVLQNVHDGNPVTGLVALNNDKILSVSTVGTMGLFDWRYNVFPKDKTNTNGAETESSGSGSSRGSTMVEDGVCLHRFFLSTKPLYGVAFEGKQKVATFGEEAHWRLLRFTQDMNVLDLKTKLY
jgi:WD40 repeat protein